MAALPVIFVVKVAQRFCVDVHIIKRQRYPPGHPVRNLQSVRRKLSMSVSHEKEAKILRYYHVEKWKIGTISRQLGIHHSVVKRVLLQAGIPKAHLVKRQSILDTFLSFVHDTLIKYPKLTASRLYDMVCTRGYSGGPDHFRHAISLHRPRPHAEAYLRLRTLPAEEAQVDWGLCLARHNPHYADSWNMPSNIL